MSNTTVRPNFPTAIDSTMRASWSACQTKFRNSFLFKKAAISESVHLVFGGAYAAGLEAMRRSYYGAGDTLLEAREIGAKALVQHWLKSGFTTEPEGTPKTLARCINAFDSYLDFFNPSTDHIRPYAFGENPHDVAVEFTFALPIPGIFHPQTNEPLLYSGRFDMLAQSNAGGALYVVDDKTAGQLGKSLTNSMRLKAQFTGYTWACQQYGYSVNGVIIRATQALKTKIEHVELIEQRPPHMVERWLEQLQLDAENMILAWKTGFFEHSFDEACGSYGGCEFQDSCAASDEINVLLSMYKDRDWDPLHITPSEAA